MKTARKIVLGISLSLLTVNCSRVGFTKQEEASGVQSIEPGTAAVHIIEALATCASAAAQNKIQERDYPIFFDNPLNEVGSAPVCSWNQSGNIAPSNGYMTARYSQFSDISLPAGAVLCGADFVFAAQAMEYDDTFFFTVNNHILATNDDYWLTNHLSSQQLAINANQSLSLSTYDWSLLVGQPNSARAMKPAGGDYCLGEKEGLSQCSWPRTETAGTISMSVSSNIMTALGLKAQSGNIRFGFTTTGDDNAVTDCQHEPLSLKIKVRYVIP